MVVRLYAMYQRSKRMLIFLVVTVLAVQITSGVIITILSTGYISGEEYVLSGTYSCDYGVLGDVMVLNLITWVLGTVGEIIALCLAVWIAVKHFRELQRPSAGWTVDCFTILIKTHVFYFASFVAVSCLQLIEFSPKFSSSTAVAEEVVLDIVGLTQIVQMFILGPRLILGVREFHANLVANSDEGPGMTSIAFQERVHISTGSGV
ncbi:hypothetical protein K503DRAFT_778111 [Rhizopogon vinicolor AM-OR11-026]|uniref:Uncharacterized protein n=1 Tax=Rhizopogon vinicolor AM-OR11-026 TaxID=1314800 RepID=A0A1B7MDC4_9AGAM|nr:hypothetical protein K503DRAFT_778111 [Rhizopogon vinicolor AM-OR11-026]